MSAKRIPFDVSSIIDRITDDDNWKITLLNANRNITREELILLDELKKKGPRWKLSETEPIRLPDRIAAQLFITQQRHYALYIYQNCVYIITQPHTDVEMRLLVFESADTERKRFERLKAKFDSGVTEHIAAGRITIPEQVRIAVWRRDQGKCVNCGSRQNLEYDHIIPVSQGGSSTVRNIELLCEQCNRSKGKKIQ